MVRRPENNPNDTGSSNGPIVRRRVVMNGILQGIGCRPTVFRLAESLSLGGWVVNSNAGVILEVEGPREACDEFEQRLLREIPPPGRIDEFRVAEREPTGDTSFRIESSLDGERTVTPIPPDVAVCERCVSELFDPDNHRYVYPFITCTLCGPRFTVVRDFPYDRERTTMADFTMCPECAREYGEPTDRRFHSQTNSCPECGPVLWLTDNAGNRIPGDPVTQAVDMLGEGKILAIKGIGGFHLACNAHDEDAVGRLRDRKGRPAKPFAVMMPDMETVRRYCRVNEEEDRLLTSATAPIVLLPADGEDLARNVAPAMGTLGVMLPYAPLHHLLFRHPDVPPRNRPIVLVMTSGNRSEEPIARDNDEALERLRDLADAFLLHNREIALSTDDSIFRVIADRPTVFRRARGLVPGEFPLIDPNGPESTKAPSSSRVILGAGGDIKNAPAIVKAGRVVPGTHVGDLATPEAQEYFRKMVGVLADYLEARPDTAAIDPHPEYFSGALGRQSAPNVEEVLHHHAHAVALLFELGFSGPAVFAVFDGTGYGGDETIWGGEFLIADRTDFTRAAYFDPFPLPGGEAAIKDPIRIAAGLLAQGGTIPEEFVSLMRDRASVAPLWIEAAAKGINAPLTSSVGRLFDAAAAILGFSNSVTFEGEAAMWLEGIASPHEHNEYPVGFIRNDPPVIDSREIIRSTARDMADGTPPARVATRFHNTVARAVALTMERIRAEKDIGTVGLTGGCFQNKLLTERTNALLREFGFTVLLHRDIPPNDGGIAVGQAVCAFARSAPAKYSD